MKFCIFLISFVLLFGCKPEVNRPEIRENSLNYRFEVRKYLKQNDSISSVKTTSRKYRLDIIEGSDSFYAIWTERISTTTPDSTPAENESVLNTREYTDGLGSHFRLDDNGDIDSLINWPEVKSYTEYMNTLYLEMNGYSQDEIDKLAPFLKSLLTKEYIMNTLFKGIDVFHNFYSIEASYTDSLVEQGMSFDINKPETRSKAKILITRPAANLVDYIVTAEYSVAGDENLSQKLEELSGNEFDLSMLNQAHVVDTVYYRFNSDLQELLYVFAKRNMAMDSLQFFQEISIEKE